MVVDPSKMRYRLIERGLDISSFVEIREVYDWNTTNFCVLALDKNGGLWIIQSTASDEMDIILIMKGEVDLFTEALKKILNRQPLYSTNIQPLFGEG